MRIFRNPSVKRLLFITIPLSTLLVSVGFFLAPRDGWFALAVCGAITALLLIHEIRFLRLLNRLTDYVQNALDGGALLNPSENREGELSIFQNELYKLAAALRQQLDRASEDKRHLADSLADISHQLKTPLTAMNILVRLLRQPHLAESDRMRCARELDALTKRMDWLTQALLKLSRLDAGAATLRPERISADDLIARALEPLLSALDLRDVQVERRGAAQDALECDVAWTVEALTNILKNCLEHSPPGACIRISHEENPLKTAIVIADEGGGIDEDDLNHIFERFYRGKNAAPDSVGIGLALTRQIVATQGGVVLAQNAARGARFILEFPKRVV